MSRGSKEFMIDMKKTKMSIKKVKKTLKQMKRRIVNWWGVMWSRSFD
jgi:hypothetical protein